jgi:hypothetical protein
VICHQLRSIFYICTRFDVDMVARHTLGANNVAADVL